MKKTKFTERQTIVILNEQEADKPVSKRIKELETELAQYKKIVAEQMLEIANLNAAAERMLLVKKNSRIR